MQAVLAEKWGLFAGVPSEVALASSEDVAGLYSPAGSGSLGASEDGPGSHFVGGAAGDLEMHADTGGGHHAEGACDQVGNPVGSGEGAEY